MFYIQPPKGLVSLHILEEIILSRLEYLNTLGSDKKETFTGKFEYLFEGSTHDCIGHFILRLLTFKSNEFFSSWLTKETLLLKKRLSLISPSKLYKLFKTIVKHLKRRDSVTNPSDKVLMKICVFFMTPKIFKHIVSKTHSEDCNDYHKKINFELIPDLVEKKTVDLCKGAAIVYCSQWKDLLQSLFQTFILFETESNQNFFTEHFFSDPQINFIWHKLQHCTVTKSYNYGYITASNIDQEIHNFPPCMEHLYLILRRKHRLSHYARFYYTLFLKECGMNVEDAIVYWKNEYSKPHDCDSLCTHDWHKDSKKFIYSIRHMYGLEGAKKNYNTPNCNHLCEEIPNSNYEGGCPFKNFDFDSLKSLLSNSMTEKEVNQFLATELKTNPTDTCSNFFKYKSMTHVRDITITKPTQYYKKMLKLN